MGKYEWQLLDNSDLIEIKNLSVALNDLDFHLTSILVRRGVKTFEEAKAFFRPDLSMLHNPFLMNGMEAAVDHLVHSLENRKNILLFGDYDVDGTTAVTLMSLFFELLDFDFEYYIPDRYNEGYGLSKKGILYAKEINAETIITIDCGLNAKTLL